MMASSTTFTLGTDSDSRDSFGTNNEIPPEEDTVPAEEQKVTNEVSKSTKPTRLRGMKALANSMAEVFGNVTADNLFQYEWPPMSGDKYFLQEQLMEFLVIKSFKRKYPEMPRRSVELAEREFLRSHGVVSETLQNLGLTALPSTEVLDLMSNDYPDHFTGYQKVLADRAKEEMAAKQKEMETIKADSGKLAELRKRAVKAASEWNADMNRDRKRERKQFCDIQTMVVQSPSSSYTKLPPELTKPGPYPVALMPQQFQNYSVKFTSEQLNRLPLNTVIDSEDLVPVHRPPSPGPIIVTEMELQDTGEQCSFCREQIYNNDKWVQCCQCGSGGHPFCMEMTQDMYDTVKQYNWMCIECKPCSVCTNIDQEDKMLFCDRCDRGYHTFCVGLDALPSGRWLCAKFCGGQTSSGRNTPAESEIKKCSDCGDRITRLNKVHHRSKNRHLGLCNKCVTKQQQ